ncbi:MAG: hypothetical protein QM741_18245 [Rudaea sp.]|uniref:hypothetical protein n=1 Tax=Rudaea sp. TaxID=2136325 RepID=UPI0039E57546
MRTLVLNLLLWLMATSGAAATQSTDLCADIYLTVPKVWGSADSPPVFEVSVSENGSPFHVQGKLGVIDWGGFRACGERVELKFRTILQRSRLNGPIIKDFDRTYPLRIQSEGPIYFRLGKGEFREISTLDGKRDVSEINQFVENYNNTTAKIPYTSLSGGTFTRDPIYIAGMEWLDRRDYYYSKKSICVLERSERCP